MASKDELAAKIATIVAETATDATVARHDAAEIGAALGKRNSQDPLALSGLRVEAGYIYATDLTINSYADLRARLPELRQSRTTDTTLSIWAEEDDWIGKRQRIFAELEKEGAKRLATQLTQARLDEFKRMEVLRKIADLKLESNTVKPRSWEGVARARIEIGRRLDDLQKQITAELSTQIETSPMEQAAASIDLTAEEREELATFILDMRKKRVAAPDKSSAFAKHLAESIDDDLDDD